MTAEQVLRDVAARGIALSAEGDRLRWKAPPGRVTPATISLLRTHKAELIALLTTAKSSREMDDRRALYLYAKQHGFPMVTLAVAQMKVDAGETNWRAFAQREGYYTLFEAGLELEVRQ